MNDFLNFYFGKNSYQITQLAGWKDNITSLIQQEHNSFVIQKTKLIPYQRQKAITKSIEIYNKYNLHFSDSYWKQRFINFENNTYSFMQILWGNIISETTHSQKLMHDISKYLANIHNISEQENLQQYYGYIQIPWFKDIDRLFQKAETYNLQNNQYQEIFTKFKSIYNSNIWTYNLRKWLIHGDPVFKNFLINPDNEICWIIDYEMMEVTDFLWDLVDMIRWNMKLDWFQKTQYLELIENYEAIRPLTSDEKKALPEYLKAMICNTGIRYFLALFPESEYYNHIWNTQDSIKKAHRCLDEIQKAELFFK